MKAVRDAGLIAGRNLRRFSRNRQVILFSTIQPVLVLVLFSYVFGGVVRLPGVSYLDYITPAVLIQTLAFSSSGTGINLAMDLQSGVIDRFRSLPIARSAVIAGRLGADGVRIAFQTIVMIAFAHVLGFRFHNGVGPALLMIVLVVAFGLTMAVYSAFIGIKVQHTESVQAASFMPVFPLVFISSFFAPVATLPGWMQVFARVNPMTAAADTLRALSLGGPVLTSLWHLLLWIAVLVAIFGGLGLRAYRRIT